MKNVKNMKEMKKKRGGRERERERESERERMELGFCTFVNILKYLFYF